MEFIPFYNFTNLVVVFFSFSYCTCSIPDLMLSIKNLCPRAFVVHMNFLILIFIETLFYWLSHFFLKFYNVYPGLHILGYSTLAHLLYFSYTRSYMV